MDKANLAEVPMADKITELTPEQKQALFFGRVQPAYDFGTFRCGSGLEGLYIGILKLQRQNSDLNQDNLNILNTHKNDEKYILTYLIHQVDQNAPPGALREDMLAIIHSIGSPEEKVNKFIAYMDALQPYLCPKTYSHEDAIKFIMEAVNSLDNFNKNKVRDSHEFDNLAKTTAQFDDKIAPVLGIKPGQPNPARNIIVTMPGRDLMVVYLALRYGIKVYAFRPLDERFDQPLINYFINKNYLPKGIVKFVYGHDSCYNLYMNGNFNYKLDADLVFHNTGVSDDVGDIAILGPFVSWMPVGSQVLMTPLKKYSLTEDFIEFIPVSMSEEEMQGSSWHGPVVVRKRLQKFVFLRTGA